MNILILGCNGYLGQAITHGIKCKGYNVTGVDLHNVNYAGANNYIQADLSKGEEAWKIIKDLHLTNDITINLIGLVGYKKCDENPQLATLLNAEFPATLIHKPTIHFSAADSIYGLQDLTKLPDGCITEHVVPNPQSHYGRTKLEGEKAILAGGNARVFRLSSVFGISPIMRWDVLIHNWLLTLVQTNSLEVYDPRVIRSFAFLPCIIEGLVGNGRPTNQGYLQNFQAKPLIQNVCNFYSKKIDIARTLAELFDKPNITIKEGKDPEGRNYIIDTEHDKIFSPYQGNIQWYLEPRKAEYPYNIFHALLAISRQIVLRAYIEHDYVKV